MLKFSDGKYLKTEAVSLTKVYKQPSYFVFFIKKWELSALLRKIDIHDLWEIPATPGCKGSVSVKWDGPQRRLAPNHIESGDGEGIKNTEVFFLKWDFGNNLNVGAKPFIIV